ncbi:MAG TPA: glycosyltransferase family 39 protein [Chloroflexota bacterium]|nr:glycosyltransferase family 39 protein [Chloroflexota bacterium]
MASTRAPSVGRVCGFVPLAALVGLALLPRLVLHWVVADYRAPWPWEVEVMSRALVEHGTLAYDWFGRTPLRPSAFLPPVYPLVVAAAMWTDGADHQATLRVWQIVLSTVSVVLVVPLARELTGSRPAAWIAGALAAVYPSFVAATAQITTATLEVFWVEVFALALLRWHRHERWPWLGLAGLTLGLLALTRGPAVLLWPVVALWLLAVRNTGDLRRGVARLAVFTAFAVLPALPWTARNYLVIGAPVVIATNTGYNFWIGHNPAATGEFDSTQEANQPLVDLVAPLSEPERDAFYLRTGLRYLVSHPAEEARLSLRKLWYFVWFRPGLGSSYPNAGRLREVGELALAVGYGAVLPAAVVGAWLSRRAWRRLFVVYGIWVAYALGAVAFFAATRYRAPVEPFLIAFASLMWARVIELIRRGRAGRESDPDRLEAAGRRGRLVWPDARSG